MSERAWKPKAGAGRETDQTVCRKRAASEAVEEFEGVAGLPLSFLCGTLTLLTFP